MLAVKNFTVVNINYTLIPQASLKQYVQEIIMTLKFVAKTKNKYFWNIDQIIFTE